MKLLADFFPIISQFISILLPFSLSSPLSTKLVRSVFCACVSGGVHFPLNASHTSTRASARVSAAGKNVMKILSAKNPGS